MREPKETQEFLDGVPEEENDFLMYVIHSEADREDMASMLAGALKFTSRGNMEIARAQYDDLFKRNQEAKEEVKALEHWVRNQ